MNALRQTLKRRVVCDMFHHKLFAGNLIQLLMYQNLNYWFKLLTVILKITGQLLTILCRHNRLGALVFWVQNFRFSSVTMKIWIHFNNNLCSDVPLWHTMPQRLKHLYLIFKYKSILFNSRPITTNFSLYTHLIPFIRSYWDFRGNNGGLAINCLGSCYNFHQRRALWVSYW